MKKEFEKYYWHIVYWRNRDFIRTRYKPEKVGQVVGFKDKIKDRKGINNKKQDIDTIVKYKFLFRGTSKELKEWLAK